MIRIRGLRRFIKLSLKEEINMENENINSMEELAVNIEYCPYCGGDVLERVSAVDMYCMDCGRDFKIMTHE